MSKRLLKSKVNKNTLRTTNNFIGEVNMANNTNIDISNKRYNHCFTMDKRVKDRIIMLALEDSTFTPLDLPELNVNLKILAKKNKVIISFPSITFTLPVDGFIYTAAANLPRKLWPSDPIPIGHDLETLSGIPLLIYVYNDGTIRIKAQDGNPIPAGTYTTKSTIFIYRLYNTCPPNNFQLSTQGSNIINAVPNRILGNDYGDYFVNDIVNDRVAYCWNQTKTNVSQDQSNTGLYVRTGYLCRDEKDIKLKLNPPVLVYRPKVPTFTYESSVKIDPNNPNHIVVAIMTVLEQIVEPLTLNIIINIGVSEDFGKTWKVTPAPYLGPTGQNNVEDPNILFDKLGNLYLSFLNFVIEPDLTTIPYHSFQLWNSIDGGYTWKNIFAISSISNTSIEDYPKIAFGPDGKEGYALWYSYQVIDGPFIGPATSQQWAGFLQVLSKNNFGSHVEYPLTNIPYNSANNAVIAVGNKGQVFIGLEQNINGDLSSPGVSSYVLLSLNPTGTVNFSAKSFEPVQPIFISNLVNPSGNGNPVPWQPNRGIYANAFRFFAYDEKKNRLYVVGIDRRPNYDISSPIDIFYTFTEDNGTTWSPLKLINDVSFGSRGLPSVAFDNKLGLLSVGWYDTRNYEPDETTVDYWGAIFKP